MKEKYLNFNCVEVMSALLDRSKVQTIRRAFELKVSDSLEGSNISNASIGIPKDFDWVEKPAKFKVGDRVKLYWDKDSKYEWFCAWCGSGADVGWNKDDIFKIKKYGCDCRNNKDLPLHNSDKIYIKALKRFGIDYKSAEKRAIEFRGKWFFPQCLGEVEITEVFKVTIHKSGDIRGVYNIHDLITKDGFRTMIDFTNYFDKNYDLSTPRPFWVYRWKYLEGE